MKNLLFVMSLMLSVASLSFAHEGGEHQNHDNAGHVQNETKPQGKVADKHSKKNNKKVIKENKQQQDNQENNAPSADMNNNTNEPTNN